jgi:hypothetical protein
MGEGGGDHEDDGIEHVMPQRPDSFDCLGSRPWESIYVAVGSGASSAWVSSIRRMSVSLHGQRHGVAFTTRSDDLCARGRRDSHCCTLQGLIQSNDDDLAIAS